MKKLFWSVLCSLPVFAVAWWKAGDFSLFPLGVAVMVLVYATWQVQENLETYRETRKREIPRQTGVELWWIIFSAPDRTALFDALNVSHESRQRLELLDRLMDLPPDERSRVMDVMVKKVTKDKEDKGQ
jgi:hypothetical protein